MKKGFFAALAALLILLAGWITQDGCTADALACNMAYLQAAFAALSDVLTSLPVIP
jgi:hypothetical protein